MTLTTRYIDVNGITLHCKVAGQGPLMVLLHGFPEFWYSWRKQLPVLAQSYTVVAPDMRGYNLSDKPKGIKNYTLEVLMNDIRALIKAFGQESAIVVGHDWGGVVAWSLAGYYPEMVEKLIILNMPHPAEMKRQLKQGNWQQWRKSWYMGFFQLPYLPEWYMKRNLTRFFKRSLQGWAHQETAFTDADIQAYVTAYEQPNALTATINYYRALRHTKRSDKLRPQKLMMPVCLIFGEDDKALGKELTYNTAHYCKGALSIKYIPNCSHWVQHEYPELVNKYIVTFLKQ